MDLLNFPLCALLCRQHGRLPVLEHELARAADRSELLQVPARVRTAQDVAGKQRRDREAARGGRSRNSRIRARRCRSAGQGRYCSRGWNRQERDVMAVW